MLSWQAWYTAAVEAEQEGGEGREGERRKERELPEIAYRLRVAKTAEHEQNSLYNVPLMTSHIYQE